MDERDDFMVTLNHLHSVPAWGGRPGFCHRGARALCERYGLDWTAIVRAGGLPASVLDRHPVELSGGIRDDASLERVARYTGR